MKAAIKTLTVLIATSPTTAWASKVPPRMREMSRLPDKSAYDPEWWLLCLIVAIAITVIVISIIMIVTTIRKYRRR